MAEIKIEKDEYGNDKINIPDELKDSSVGEKFVMAYFENDAKVKLEMEKTKQVTQEMSLRKHKRWSIMIVISLIIAVIFVSIYSSKENENENSVVKKVLCECNCSNKIR